MEPGLLFSHLSQYLPPWTVGPLPSFFSHSQSLYWSFLC